MLLQLAEELRRRGREVVTVGPRDGGGWLGEQFRRRGFPTETFALTRTLDPSCVTGLTSIVSRYNVQVLHSHEFTLGFYGSLAARWTKRVHVITMHGGKDFATALRRRLALRAAATLSNAINTVSEAARDHLARALWMPRRAVHVVPNGIRFARGERGRVRQELGVAEDEVLVVAVGNLYEVKGHRVLLESLARLAPPGAVLPCHVAIAGQGHLESEIRAIVDARGWRDHVRLLGVRDDIPDILAAADVYAMPSLSEGLPLALIEAMMAGTAIVASRVGGIPEAVLDGTHALLVPPGDPAELGEALGRLIGDRDLRARLGAAAAQRANLRYNVTAMTDAYESLYEGRGPSL